MSSGCSRQAREYIIACQQLRQLYKVLFVLHQPALGTPSDIISKRIAPLSKLSSHGHGKMERCGCKASNKTLAACMRAVADDAVCTPGLFEWSMKYQDGSRPPAERLEELPADKREW